MARGLHWERTRRGAKRGSEMLDERWPEEPSPPLKLPKMSSKKDVNKRLNARAKRSTMNRKVKVTLADKA